MYDVTEIIRAIDRDSLSHALSKLEVFARTMGLEELAEWARLEMHGYQGRPEFVRWAEAHSTGDQEIISHALMALPAHRRSFPINISNGPFSACEHLPMAYGISELESSSRDGAIFPMKGVHGRVSSASIQTLFTKVRIEARRKLHQCMERISTLQVSDPKSAATTGRLSDMAAGEQSRRPQILIPSKPLHVGAIKGKVHVAIITVRPDEYAAMEDRLGETVPVEGGNNSYEHSVITTESGTSLSVVLTRVATQGNTPAQAVANNIIHEIDPAWLFLVGIAGGVPDHEFCLGDVIIASYLHDFSLKAVTEEKTPTYQSHGGPMHPAVDRFLQTKIAGKNATRLLNLAGLLTDPLLRVHPMVFDGATSNKTLFYGDDSFRRKVEEIITNRFPRGIRNGPPRIWPGPCANGDMLVKSAMLLQEWQESARQLTHVETELAGVYAAARSAGRQNYPLLAIRGLSDIVGLRRDPAWTTYACRTSAALAFAVLRSGFIDFDANLAKERLGSSNATAMLQVEPTLGASSMGAFWAADIVRRIHDHTEAAFAQGDREALERGPLLQISTPAQKYTGFVRFARYDRSSGGFIVDPNSQEALQVDTDGTSEFVPMSEVNGVRDPAPNVLVEGGHFRKPGPRSDRYRGPRR